MAEIEGAAAPEAAGETPQPSGGKEGVQARSSSSWWMGRSPLILGLVLILVGVSLVALGPLRTSMSDQQALARGDVLGQALAAKWSEPEITPVNLDEPQMSRKLGEGFAFIYIPRLGSDWRAVIVEGVDQPDLEGAIGHFPGTADPGMLGNFALAGHRNMDGSLFGNLDQVSKGDKIIIETRERWNVYTVTGSSIISPSQVDAVSPVPFEEGATPTKAVITLTTCHPWWSSAQRLALFGKLTETRLKTMGPPADLPAASLKK